MAGIVIYGSQYGTAKQYAEELAKRTGIEALRYGEVQGGTRLGRGRGDYGAHGH